MYYVVGFCFFSRFIFHAGGEVHAVKYQFFKLVSVIAFYTCFCKASYFLKKKVFFSTSNYGNQISAHLVIVDMHAVLTCVEDDTCGVSTHIRDDKCVECVVFVDKQLTRERGLKQHACFNSVESASKMMENLVKNIVQLS